MSPIEINLPTPSEKKGHRSGWGSSEKCPWGNKQEALHSRHPPGSDQGEDDRDRTSPVSTGSLSLFVYLRRRKRLRGFESSGTGVLSG